jgi:hypothetical protein
MNKLTKIENKRILFLKIGRYVPTSETNSKTENINPNKKNSHLYEHVN